MFRHARKALCITNYPFDAVYYINMQGRPDRRKHMEKILDEFSFFHRVPLVERIEGINGEEIDVNGLHRAGQITDQAMHRYNTIPLSEKFYGMDLTTGAIGCALSHRAVWQKIIARAHTCTLILEDDVELSPEFPWQINSRMSTAPKDWELLYLGGVDLLSAGKPPRPIVSPGWRRAYAGQRELTAYVLNKQGAQVCLDLTKCLNWQIDTHICEVTAPDFDADRSSAGPQTTESNAPKTFQPDGHAAQDRYITKPMSYALHPTLAIQLSRFGTNVQKSSEAQTGDAYTIDAKRRIREFYSGLTSVR